MRAAAPSSPGVGLRLGLQALDRAHPASGPLGQLRRGALGRIQPHPEPLGGRLGGVEARRQALALRAPRGQRLFRGLAAHAHGDELRLDRLGGGAGSRDGGLGPRQCGPRGASTVAGEGPARLVALALDALVQLGGLGLALQRLQPCPRLALDVQRAIQVVLRALELELRATAALAVLAEPGRLLDQHPPVARLGGDDRLDAALGDDGVHLLAEARVGEDLDHVDEPALGAVDAVLALPRAVQPPQDRDLADRQVQPTGGVVEHDLDLGLGSRLDAAGTREDHVLHRLAANGQGRLLAHRPQHRVGDIGLARAVGPDDHRHAGREGQPRAVGEGLEALQGDRAQVHAIPMGPGCPAPPRRRPARHPSSSARSRVPATGRRPSR